MLKPHLPPSLPDRPPSSPRATALKVAGLYLVVSCAWIIFSDRALEALSLERQTNLWLQNAKGLGFVLVTAMGLFVVVRGYVASLQQYHAAMRAAEQAQMEALAIRARVLNSVRADIALLDHEGNVIAANESWEAHAGRFSVQPDAPGKRANYLAACAKVTDGRREYAAAGAAGVRAVLAGQAPQFVLEYPFPSTPPIFYRLEITPLADDPSRGVVIVRTDVTERKLAEQVLLRAQAELEERVSQRTSDLVATNAQLVEQIAQRQRVEEQLDRARLAAEAATQAKSAFLANTSHEIRTPLTAILGYTDLLLGKPAGDAERAEYLAVVQQNAWHLLTLIDDILDLSRAEAGKLQVARTACSLRQILEDTEALMRPRAAAKALQFAVECAADVPATIHTDATRLRQVLMNLLGNAIKFTAAGSVRLVVRPETMAGRTMLRFEVIDTGPGIAAEEQQRIFQPFHQLDGSSTRVHGGSGLGLSIVRQLAAMLGGSISVQSAVGAGSTFVLLINPSAGDDGVTSSLPVIEAPAAKLARRLSGRVLLAEDNANIRRLVSVFLEQEGAVVRGVDNGEDAVRLALEAQERQEAFDLVLLDVQMPRLDGVSVARELRRRNYAGPVVMLSAYTSEAHVAEWRMAGCNDVLYKPIDRPALLGVLRQYLAESGGAGGPAGEGMASEEGSVTSDGA